MHVRTCICGKAVITPKQSGRPRLYCSSACKRRSYRQRQPDAYREQRRKHERSRLRRRRADRPGTTRAIDPIKAAHRRGDHSDCDPGDMRHGICSECGKTVYVTHTSASPERRRCRDCQQARPKPRNQRPIVALICFNPACGKEFAKPRSEIVNDHPCCSAKCAMKVLAIRQGRALDDRNCLYCGELFHPAAATVRCCSYTCAGKLRGETREGRKWPSSPIYAINCGECGKLFIARSSQVKLCSLACRRKRASRAASEVIKARYRADPEFRDLMISRAHNRHASKLGVGTITTPVALVDYLMRRDRGRCGICRQPVRAKKGPRRPSIDHIVPLSRGGEHALENLQLAHYSCNLSKNNGFIKGGEQLVLIG